MEKEARGIAVQTVVHHLMREWRELPSFHRTVDLYSRLTGVAPDAAHDDVVATVRERQLIATGTLITESGRTDCAVGWLSDDELPGVDWSTVRCAVAVADLERLDADYQTLHDVLVSRLEDRTREVGELSDYYATRTAQLAAQLTEFEVN